MKSRLLFFLRSFILLLMLCLSISCSKEEIINVRVSPDDKIYGKTICIIGDSISSFAGSAPSDITGYDGEKYLYFYPRGDVDDITDMWWYKVAQIIGLKENQIVNCSWSGSTVTGDNSSKSSAYAACSLRRIEDVASKGFIPSIILCFISCNDWGRNLPVGSWMPEDDLTSSKENLSFRESYALMLSRLSATYPASRIFCMTILEETCRDKTPGWPSNNDTTTIGEWNRNIIELAHVFGCGIIDLQESGINYANILSYSIGDGLHPNSGGMNLIAEKVVKELLKQY